MTNFDVIEDILIGSAGSHLSCLRKVNAAVLGDEKGHDAGWLLR